MPVVKNPPAKAGDIRDPGSIPGWGRFPGGGLANIIILVKGNRGNNGIFMKKIFNTTDGTLHMGKHIWVVKYCVSGLTRAH